MPNDYMTSRELGIAPWERKRLIQLMKGLRSGRFVHIPDWSCAGVKEAIPSGTRCFNMGISTEKSPFCSTAACIGGWIALLENKQPWEATNYVNTRSGCLHTLFYPTHIGMRDITPHEAADAIERFLSTGNPNWSLTAEARLEKEKETANV